MERTDRESEPVSGSVPLRIQNILDRLAEAMNRRRELASMLCDIRKDICYCIELRKLSREDIHNVRQNAWSRSPDVARYIDDLHEATKTIPLRKLRQAFIETHFLWDSRVIESKWRAKPFVSPLIWLCSRPECRNCGLPVPPGRRKFCSDVCAEEYAKKAMPRPTNAANPPVGARGEEAGPQPQAGSGDRKLDCQYYDNCLDLAVFEEWENFHCEGCGRRDVRTMDS